MLDKIFNKKKKQQDILTVPQRKVPLDLKALPKLGPKALQQIVLDQEKYIGVLVSRIQQIRVQYIKMQQKVQELRQKNEVINAQISKMSNQHQQLTIKFDNLQNSLQIMISTNQQHLTSQLNFIKTLPQALSPNQTIPKTIDQVFALYQDRFQLCSKISQQNKFLKEKITDIQVKFQEITERYQEAEKQKGFNSLIPELMVSLQELKRERKNSNSSKRETTELQSQVLINETNEKSTLKQAQTMTSDKMILPSQKKQQNITLSSNNDNNSSPTQCLLCKDLTSQINELKQQIESLTQTKDSLIEEVGEWGQKYQSLLISEASLKEQIKCLTCEKVQKEKVIKQMNEQIQSLTKSNKKNVQESQSINTKIESLQSSLKQIREQNHQLKIEIETRSFKLATKQAELNSLTMKLAQLAQNKQTQSVSGQQQTQKQKFDQKSPSLTAIYEQKITSLTSQTQTHLQQIITLKQQIITKTSQITILTQSLQKSQSHLVKLKESLASSQQLTQQVQLKYKKLMVQNEDQLMDKIRSLDIKNSENQKELIYLRNNKLTQQQEIKKLLTLKKTLQQQLKQLQTYQSDIQSRILPSLRQQLQSSKKLCSRITQQKQIIHQNSLQNINQLNSNYQFLLTQKQFWAKDMVDLENQLAELKKENQSKKGEIQSFEQMTNKLNQEMTDKLLQVERLTDELKNKSQETQELYEELRSKQRKYESQLNQQRIKLQTMKRTISVQQTKLQQNQKSSNKFYQQSMHKDKKISYMEVKLKQYKHLIQSLKKQKEQVEKSYIEKIKTYEESITEVVSEEEANSERNRKNNNQEKQQSFKNIDVTQSESFSSEKDTQYFKNQILSYEQSNLVLTEENASLRQQIKQLQQQMQDRKKQVESLQEKREQTLKEIEKLNLRSINGSLQQTNSNFIEKQKQFMKEREQFQSYKQKAEQRMKKIALKAYKGFDILLKRHHSLYKEFMAVFVKEIADREQVKNIQSEINTLVNKSTDMKDVFQDYL